MARKDLPAPGSPNFAPRLREEVHALMGKLGDGRDRALTLREAIETGVLVPGPGGTLTPGGGAGSGGTTVVEYEPDLTPPPQPGAFSATPGITFITISQAQPFYTQGHGHNRTVVYGAQWVSGPLPVFADAVEIGRFDGTVWAMASNPATTWHLWIKWESVDRVLSPSPSGGTNGVTATTGQDVSSLLEALTEQITAGQLASSLSTPISQIPGMQTAIASNETDIANEAAARALALAAEASARATAIANEASIRADADDGLQQQIDLISAASTGDLTALIDAVNQERDARIADVLEAENAAATADGIITSALASEASARGIADGALSNANAVTAQHASGTRAGLLAEQTIRATADGALAATTTTLAATMGGSVAALKTEASTRATADAAQSAYQTTLAAQTAQTAAAVVSVQTASATADAAQAGQITSLSANTAQAAAAVQVEASVRATADTAQVTRSDAMAAQIGASASAIQTEQTARATVDAALALQTETLSVAVGANQAVIQTEITARASADAAQSSVVAVLATRTGENVAGLVTEQTARTTQDAALAQSITTTQATTGANIAAISAEQSSRTTADTALATQINVVGAATSDNAARIRTEETARATADAALAARSDALTAASAGAMASINVEQQARTTADTSLATQVNSVLAMTGAAAAGILTEQTARATADAALAQTSTSLQVVQAGNAAAIQAEATARTTADTAAADQIQSIGATAAGAAAAVQSEQSARAGADAAQAATSTALAASLAGNVSAIATEQTARATQDSSIAQRVDVLTAATGASSSAISAVQTASATGDASLAAQVATLTTVTGDNASAIANVSTVVSNNFATQAGQITTLQSRVDRGGSLTPRLEDWKSLAGHNIVTIADGKVGSKALRLTNVVSNPNSGVIVPIDRTKTYRVRFWARPSADANGTLYHALQQFQNEEGTILGPLNSGLSPYKPNNVTRAQHNTLFGVTDQWGEYSYLWRPADWQAGVTHVRSTFLRNFPGGAGTTGYWEVQDYEFREVTQLESLSASIAVESTTRATQTGELYAQYTVKTDVGGLVSGYGLASSAVNAAPTSAFGVQAGQFFVAPPAVASATAPASGLFKGYAWRDTVANVTKYWTGSAWSTSPQALPFVVQAVPQTINGFTVEAGIYADNAFFARLVATRGQIGLLAVDDARIADLSVSKLTAGSIAVGQFAQSTGYVAGSAGWRINGDGTAEFSGVVVRGTIFASQGAIGGWNIGSNYLQSTTYVLGEAGTRLNSDGTGQIGGVRITDNTLESTTFDTPAEPFGFRLRNDGASELRGAVIRSGAGKVLLTAVGDAVPPWVTTLQQANEDGITLVSDPDPATNTAKIKSLFAGYLTDIDTTDEAVTISAISPTIPTRIDQTQNSTTWADVQGVSWPVEANAYYEFDAFVFANPSTTSGRVWDIGFVFPSGTIASGASLQTFLSGAARGTTLFETNTLDASTRLVFQATQSVADGPVSVGHTQTIKGLFYTGATAGVVQVQFRRASGSGSNVLRRGSIFKLRKANIAPELGALASPQTFPTTAASTRTGTYEAKPSITVAMKTDGTWYISRSGTTTLTGNWMDSAPLGAGPSQNFDVKFEVTARSIGGSGPDTKVSTSFTASNWTQMTSERKAAVTLTVDSYGAPAGTRTCFYSVTVKVRQRSTQVETTLGTIACTLTGTVTATYTAPTSGGGD